jgi:STE24 endopeptidase
VKAPALVLAGCLVAVVVLVLLTVPFPVLPGAHPHVDVARDFTSAQLAREEAFHRALRPWAYASLALGLVVAGVLALTRAGARLVALVPGHWTLKTVGGTALVFLVGSLLTLPLDLRSESVLREYGLSSQTWAGWFDDRARSFAVGLVTTSLVLLPLLALARRMPTRWWATGGLVAAVLVVAGSFLYPVLVEPVFNKFTPMPAGPTRTALLELADRDHVPVKDVLVADASRRTTALNAYVSGFGSTRRIVVYDTLLKDASEKELELVVAHELGHAKEQDVLHGTVIGAFGAVAGICALYLLLSWEPLLRRAGADGPGDPRVVPLVLFLGVLAPLLLSPLTNLVSRHIEARADVHSLELTHDVPTFVSSEQRLAVKNLSDLEPGPLVYALFFTHPSSPERIAMAREWGRQHP